MVHDEDLGHRFLGLESQPELLPQGVKNVRAALRYVAVGFKRQEALPMASRSAVWATCRRQQPFEAADGSLHQ